MISRIFQPILTLSQRCLGKKARILLSMFVIVFNLTIEGADKYEYEYLLLLFGVGKRAEYDPRSRKA